MKKLLVTMTIALLNYSAFAGEATLANEEVASLIEQYDNETLVVISNELVKMANEEEGIGEFDLASTHYDRALKIREAIGMKSHKSFASIQYLASQAYSKAGNFCEASLYAKKASEAFRSHGIVKYEEKAQMEAKEFAKACAVVAAR
ncbi:tetratricopeptide repeat protein [Leptospira jelokensis]|uniref:Tetratricopeptide repeat protein n=1 Tax=Leptospira jelokensis TaxID=2484931 RepID=A0A4Z0ZTU5_9LEPT|nr:tetratricopeptide repeat protein [Leptospira jelokensis]TGL69863.1 tetratricopeptide repeat protein [Leptospira jelokensis]